MPDTPVEYFLHLAGHRIPARQVRGREAMSEPSRFEARAFLPVGVEIVAADVVKAAAALTLERADVRRRIDAVVSDVFVSHTVNGRPELEVVLEPRFALSRYRSNIKIFRNKHVLDIVSEVLGELGVSFEIRASGNYPVRPYTVQFRETDFHFVSRMLEEEGLFYFFAEGDVMVIGDNVAAYDTIGAVPFFQPAGMSRNDEAVWAMGHLAEASVGQVSLRDWCIDTPSLPMDVQARGPTASGPEFYDFPGEYDVPGDGQRLATLMAEAYACVANTVAGQSYAAGFGAGRTFSLADAPTSSLLGEHVLTAVVHDWTKDEDGFSVRFEGLPTTNVFRPPRVHEEAILPNPLTGIVTGPEGADIHCDELGRVKVHFFWDRLLPYDDDCSHWVPVMQDNTGHSVGIPRIGWEVLVHFLEGDPDRPVVLGRVYNGEDLLPLLLPDHKTKTQLGSLVSPSRDGFNLIELEDLADREKIWVVAEKDQNVKVANDRSERILVDETTNVANDETIQIGNDNIVQVGGRLSPKVKQNQLFTVGGNQNYAVATGYNEEVSGNRRLNIGGNYMRRVAVGDAELAENHSEQVGAAILEASFGDNVMTGNVGLSVTVGGAVLEVAKSSKAEMASIARTETVGAVVFSKAKEDIKHSAGKYRITNVGGALKVTSKGKMALTGVDKFSAQSMSQQHDAATELSLRVGETKLVMKEGLIHLYAPDTITIKCEADNLLSAAESYQNSGDGSDDAAAE